MVDKLYRSIHQYEVWLVNLNPTIGSEVNKTRPCIVVSPDEMNKWINTIIVVPMTSSTKHYVSRVPFKFQGVDGQVMLDQIKTIDKRRLVMRLGKVKENTAKMISAKLIEMFK